MMFPTISITRAWYSVLLCAAVALFLGVAGTPAQAHCTSDEAHNSGHKKDPCNKDFDNGEPALLTMTGFMSTANFPVRVTQDSGKRLLFADTSFELPGIQMAVDIGFCGVDPDFPGGLDAPSDSVLLAELEDAFIPAGYFEIKIDKKKLTAQFAIEYFVVSDVLDGRIRILFREDLFRTGEFPKVTANTQGGLDFPGTDLTMSGSIKIWWSNATGLSEDLFMVCDGQVVEDGQAVTVQLVPGP